MNIPPGVFCEAYVHSCFDPCGDPLYLYTEDWNGDCDQQNASIQNDLATWRPLVDVDPISLGTNPDPYIGSGFYRDRTSGEEDDDDVNWNNPWEPLGCRIIGRPGTTTLSRFGTSIAQSGTELIISAPDWDQGYLFTNIDLWGGVPDDGVTLAESGVWSFPPKPHVYQAGGYGHWGRPPGCSLNRRDIWFVRTSVADVRGGLYIASQASEHMENTLGIPDFNSDGRPDYMVGAPQANSGDGVTYVVFRRANSLEGSYDLAKLALDPHDPGRLAGVYVIGNAGEQARLGFSLAGGHDDTESAFDFNGDGVDDVAIGCPGTGADPGSVLILFGTSHLTSPASGIDVDTVLDQRQAALITGVQTRSEFGFNVANAGDFDGDGVDDLLISAPNATPMYDSNPDDSVDELDSPGLDRDLDGELDDVTGPMGIPDGVADTWDQLEGAGLAYVVFSSADTSKWSASPDDPMVISIDRLGAAQLPGFMIAGRRGVDLSPVDPTHRHFGDRLGGGDVSGLPEGNEYKSPGRSRGLAAAGDVDGDGKADILIGAILADPRVDSQTGVGTINGGEAYLIYGFEQNDEQNDEQGDE